MPSMLLVLARSTNFPGYEATGDIWWGSTQNCFSCNQIKNFRGKHRGPRKTCFVGWWRDGRTRGAFKSQVFVGCKQIEGVE